jgi:hypothetical protein
MPATFHAHKYFLEEKNLTFVRDGNTVRKPWLSRFVAAQGMGSPQFKNKIIIFQNPEFQKHFREMMC